MIVVLSSHHSVMHLLHEKNYISSSTFLRIKILLAAQGQICVLLFSGEIDSTLEYINPELPKPGFDVPELEK